MPVFFLSSPHTRGCFFFGPSACRMNRVFPAYAGVFLTLSRSLPGMPSLPRIRGGVSIYSAIAHVFLASSPHTRGCF